MNWLNKINMENKFPGKDITEDLKSKFPLAAKNKNHTSKIKVNRTIFGKLIPIMAGKYGREENDN